MQCIQNLAAKLALKRDNYSSSMDALKELHWLPVKYRIMFKCYCTYFKVVNKQAPKYFDNMFVMRNRSRNLRSNRDATAVFMEREVVASHMVTELLKSIAQNFGTNYLYT